MRVLICPDKFKGTLDATSAAEAIARGWRSIRANDALELLPISDGGDGFGELLGRHLDASEQSTPTVDAAGQPLVASWWWEPTRRLALIESARVIGLARLPRGRFHPFELDSRGLGPVLRAAAAYQPDRCLVGIGGSATNDAGFGLALALGWKFHDPDLQPIQHWTELDRLHRLSRPDHPLHFRDLTVAVDVRNPLLGSRGATRVFGPQKGIRPADVTPAERCHRRLVEVVRRQLRRGEQPSRRAGAGAAGGLGFGLLCFANATLEPGFALFAHLTRLRQQLAQVDLVLTGEGAIDHTTISMGKGVGEIAKLARQLGKPCVGLAGVARLESGTVTELRLRPARSRPGRIVRKEPKPRLDLSPSSQSHGFSFVAAIAPDLAPPEAARRGAAHWLEQLSRLTARRLSG